jgi:serine/threonine-protein kinase
MSAELLGQRYRVLGLIAEGGMSQVVAATQVYSGRDVALKMPLPGTGRDTEVAARLLREARALEVARHPGVVELLDAGVFADGRPYLALERLEGATLDACLVGRRGLSPAEAVRLAIEVCEALGPAHAGGLVHRDIKPSNVFIVRNRAGIERAKLFDFGIASLGGVSAATDHKLTQEGTFLGTPAYMAPEQLSLRKPTDQRADVYGIGAMLYESLASRLPYSGTYADILVAQLTRPPPDVREVRGDIPPALAAALLQALSREPEDRQGSVSLLRDALVAAVPMALARPVVLLAPAPGGAEESETAPIPLVTERRRHRRAPFAAHGWLTSASESSQIEITLEDVSEGGVALHAADPLPRGHLALVFVAPGATSADIIGVEAQWIRPCPERGGRLVGLRFIDPLPLETRASLRAIVALRGKDEGAP